MSTKALKQISHHIFTPMVMAFFAFIILYGAVLTAAVMTGADVRAETWGLLCLGVLTSFLLAFVVLHNYKLTNMQFLLEESIQYDALTGISTRRHFVELAGAQLNYAARNGHSCFILVFAADQFRQITDAHGHQAGDRVLAVLAARIKSIIRPYDLFARYDRESFILLAVDTERPSAESLAARLRRNIGDTPPLLFFGTTTAVSVSFGLAQIAPGASLESVIGRAYTALCAAQSGLGDGIVCGDDELAALEHGSPEQQAG